MSHKKGVKTKKHLPLAKLVTDSEKVVFCAFCNRNVDDEIIYGKLYAIGDIQCHYFCVLLSCCMVQKGKDEDGLFGFLYPDILIEIERSKKHKCSYCGRDGASLGCSVTQCRKQFHLPCGRERNAVSLFYGNFKTFCEKHAPRQRVKDEIMAKAKLRLAASRKLKQLKRPEANSICTLDESNSNKENTPLKEAEQAPEKEAETVCVICYENVEGYPTSNTFWPPCCARDAWFHRNCLQRMALSAGMHYLKCPLCNRKEAFYEAVLSQGYYVPDRDASWELEQNAFAEIYERTVTCSATECLCPMGRDHDADTGAWDIRLCILCGSSGVHAQCAPMADSSGGKCDTGDSDGNSGSSSEDGKSGSGEKNGISDSGEKCVEGIMDGRDDKGGSSADDGNIGSGGKLSSSNEDGNNGIRDAYLRYICPTCAPAAPADLDKLLVNLDMAPEPASEAPPRNVVRLRMPCRMSLRRTKQRALRHQSASASRMEREVSMGAPEGTERDIPPAPCSRGLREGVPHTEPERSRLRVESEQLLAHMSERQSKPKPQVDKSDILSDILEGVLESLHRDKTKTKEPLKEWNSPKKCSEESPTESVPAPPERRREEERACEKSAEGAGSGGRRREKEREVVFAREGEGAEREAMDVESFKSRYLSEVFRAKGKRRRGAGEAGKRRKRPRCALECKAQRRLVQTSIQSFFGPK